MKGLLNSFIFNFFTFIESWSIIYIYLPHTIKYFNLKFNKLRFCFIYWKALLIKIHFAILFASLSFIFFEICLGNRPPLEEKDDVFPSGEDDVEFTFCDTIPHPKIIGLKFYFTFWWFTYTGKPPKAAPPSNGNL